MRLENPSSALGNGMRRDWRMRTVSRPTAPQQDPSALASLKDDRVSILTQMSRGQYVLLLLILLVALFLRLYHLSEIPPGLTHDEAGNARLAIEVLEGNRPLYFSVSNGREPLYVYSMAPFIALIGPTEIAIRLTSVLWSLALILVTWAWVREAFSADVALLTAGALGVSYWPLMISRLGLRAVTLPVLFTAAVFFLWRGVRSGVSDRASYVLAGLFLGGSFYTYMASRALPLVLVLLALYLFLIRHPSAKSMGLGILVTLVIAAVIAMPLFSYLNAHPGSETRISQLAEPLRQAQAGNWEPLWNNVLASFKIFTFGNAGDPHWIYNISGKPLLDPVSGLLFYIGLALTLWRWRKPVYFFSLAWLLVGLAPVYITGADASVLRAVAVQPVVHLLQALALYELLKRVRDFPLPARLLSTAFLIALVTLVVSATVSAYFSRWPSERDVRVAYHTTLVEMARYLDTQQENDPEKDVAVISSMYPGYLHDPSSFEMTSQRSDLSVRWFDGRSALVFPPAETAYALFSSMASLDPALASLFEPYAELLERRHLKSDDLDPWFEIYRWRPSLATSAFPASQPVDLGHLIEFLGHRLETPAVAPGGTVELLTFWRVRDDAAISPQQELVLFTHVLDSQNQIVGQQDRLDVPAWNWSSGDQFAQLHRFSLDADLAKGFYPIEIGFYSRSEDHPRLPVYATNQVSPIADHILLPPIEVLSP